VDSHCLQILTRLGREKGWPQAAGAGRVFEAAGSLAGLTSRNEYEGEAAIRFESLAAQAPGEPAVWGEVRLPGSDGLLQFPSSALLAVLARHLAGGEDPRQAAAGFHATFCRLAAGIARRVFGTRFRRVVLGGGCLVNRLLIRGLRAELQDAGYQALIPRALPPGDGGLSYGQAVLGAVAAARGTRPELEGGA